VQRTSLSPKRPTPHYFEYQPAPVRVTLSAPPVAVGPYATETVIEAVLYDFGAVSVQYRIPLRYPLAELWFLDDRLDRVLAEAYEATTRRSDRIVPFFRNKAADLWRVARLQTDAALLYEGVNNALKLLGDQFLARVHRRGSQRFHLDDWGQSILRKLQTIESIYQKLSDRNANRRMEGLEWIIILLIALEVVLTLWPTKLGPAATHPRPF
jgi:hypothetical protein